MRSIFVKGLSVRKKSGNFFIQIEHGEHNNAIKT